MTSSLPPATLRRSVGAVAGLLAGVASVVAAAPAAAADRRIAIVAPIAGNPFHDAVGEGCRARAAALGGLVCTFHAPGAGDSRNQGAIVRDLVADHVAALAVSAALVSEVLPAIAAARAAGVPVVAYDADLPVDARDAFVGTDARDFGRTLGASLGRWKPDGGTYALLTGEAGSRSLADRVAGVRDALGPRWREIAGSPAVTSGEPREAARLVDRLLLEHPDLDAVVSVGAWPFLADDAWREIAGRHKDRFDRARTVIVVADALPIERRLVRDGLGHVLVGQRPADMGARIVDLLAARLAGRNTPEIVLVGFDVLTRRDLLAKPD